MERYHSLLLAIWREACRNIEVDAALERITAMLADTLPLRCACLYVVESGNRVERLAYLGVRTGEPAPPAPHIEPASAERLAAWCREGAAVQFPSSTPSAPIPASLVAGVAASVMAVPLASEHGHCGVLLLGTDGGALTPRETRLIDLLRAPLTVVLENDRRLHELVYLREAAEADKRKLLRRLGREKLTDEIVGAEDGLRAAMERVSRVAQLDVPVLILGETGSGKEVIARAIHEGSPRSAGPFIRVNCGAIPADLIDSELFGHERGSFTGAVGARKGWFERADGGTLFLDEIGELSLAAQVRLLRVLQDGSFERVGGEKQLHVNVRIVAATHQDLTRMVQENSFREDLWYRIAVFPVLLPPLRERRQDIPALAHHFARKASRRFGLRQQDPTPDDIALLTEYDWPGNVRELAAVLDRAAILGDGKRLDIAKALGPVQVDHGSPRPERRHANGDGGIETLDAAMRRHIERALSHCQGRIEGTHGAATVLEINPHTLRARMRKLGIDWKQYRDA